MAYPNTLIFVDFPSSDPAAAAQFYASVFGWEAEPRPEGVFHRLLPGQNIRVADGTQGPTGNLHLGTFDAANARPHPTPAGPEPRQLARDGQSTRTWVKVSPDDSMERILRAASELGGEVLWNDHYWTEFNGLTSAFNDPWGNTFVLWTKGDDPVVILDGWTSE